MAKKNYPFIGIYVDPHDPNIIRADMLDLYGNVSKSTKAICNSHEEKFNFRKGCEIAFNRLFDDDYIHPSDVESQNNSEQCDWCTQNPKFRIGDNVRVVDYGEHYSGVISFIKNNCPQYINGFVNQGDYDYDFNHNGATGIVVYNRWYELSNATLYVVCFDKHNDDGSPVYGVYGDKGIEKL